MKRSGVLYVYLGIFSALTVLGYCFERYLGIWRQSIIGLLLLTIGFCFYFFGTEKQKEKGKRENRFPMSILSVSTVIASGLLLSISVRLLITNLIPKTVLQYSSAGLSDRVIATVLIPSICVAVIAFVLFPRFTKEKAWWLKVSIVSVSFAPFCTNAAYIPAVMLFGLICGVCNEYLIKIRWEEIFVYYLVLLFYDTLSISIGSIDFNLTMHQVLSFLFISLSLCCMLVYLAFRALREKRVRIAEFLTVLLIAVILLCVGLAL